MKLRLKQLRIEKGWTQPELALKLGISLTYVQKLEAGNRMPGFKLAKKISDVFGCATFEELIEKNAS